MSTKDSSKVIRANAIVLEDDEGNARIIMEASGNDGCASFTLFSKTRQSQIQISSQQDDRIEIALIGGNGTSSINIVVTAEPYNCAIQLVERHGESHTVIGSVPYEKEKHPADVQMAENGNEVCSLRSLGANQ